MIVLDTNTLLRLITKDIPKDAVKVKELVNSEKELFVPDVVFPEIEYNLVKFYQYSHAQIANVFSYLNGLPNLEISVQVRSAIKLFAETKLDMADCIVAAYAKGQTLASFDKKLLKLSGAKKYWS